MSRKFRIQQARLVGALLVMALCSGLFGQQSSVVSEQAYGLEVDAESSGLLQSPDTESATDQRLAELEKMVRELREKSAKKTLAHSDGTDPSFFASCRVSVKRRKLMGSTSGKRALTTDFIARCGLSAKTKP